MESFNELMQKWVNTDYDVLVSLAKQAAAELMPTCKEVDPEHNGYYMLSSLVLSAIGADGKLTGLESRMLTDVLGLDEANIRTLINMYDSRMADLVNDFADKLGDDVKAAAIMLVTAFAAVDEKISKEETAFIKKLFE